LGIDVGGTKTLVAALDDNGVIIEKNKFPTPQNYSNFINELSQVIDSLDSKKFIAAGVGIPASIIDRKHGIGIAFGNLPWRDAPIRSDVAKLLGIPVVVENDAKLAALSEYMLIKDKYKKVLYLTISTGIGFGLVVEGVIDSSIGDGGGATMFVEYDGKEVPWESFASGRAIAQRFGKQASEIHDTKTWQIIARDLAIGLIDLVAIIQPEVIVLGGGVGAHSRELIKPLEAALKVYENPLLEIPPIQQAGRAELAVAYGCYDLAKACHEPIN
ncbi:MAG: ROK family protein, partial [Candidatus Saccharimonadales bacterium]